MAFPSLLPERGDPVRDIVGPTAGAVTARPVDPAALERPVAAAHPRSGPWLQLAAIVVVAALLVGGLLLIGSAIVNSVNKGGQLPGSPGFAGWQVVAALAALGALAWGIRAYSNRPRSGEDEGRSRGWRWLFDSRVIGSLIAVLFVVSATLVYNTPGYTPDVRSLPGEFSGLIQQAVAQKEQGYPRIRISHVGVDLLLVKGDGKTPPVKYEAFTYPNADHLLAEQGTPGNTYVYAHARTGMFWELHNLNIGDAIEIDYGGGKISRYRVSELHKNVSWKDFSWLQPTSDDRLTLQTCNGWRDEDPRFIVVARKIPDTKTALAR